jgi:single-stranded DNA-binding protein
MKSFRLTAVGNLASNPDVISKDGNSYTRFCLIGNDYAGRDEGGTAQEITTSLYFVAFNAMGEAIGRNTLKGDQLIVEGHIRANNWTDEEGQRHYGHSFIVDSFKFGAMGRLSREGRAQPADNAD